MYDDHRINDTGLKIHKKCQHLIFNVMSQACSNPYFLKKSKICSIVRLEDDPSSLFTPSF